MVKADGSHVLLANPWIQHFRSACRDETVVLPAPQENGSSTGKQSPLEGKGITLWISHHFKAVPHVSLSFAPTRFPQHQYRGRENSLVSAKRMKTIVVDTCVNDQVVPSHRHTVTGDATMNSVPAD
ncbi:hypothetical protein CK203_024725 [Vitis vinifera]|uniref:Uncharacterized protein n=1 Tax=Vitis vinifera TaxID=29760 RepID=A0A438ITP0_VITVI|nr:hypothetical protein CK203_024725 [Vitis vinifera]